MRAVVRTEYGAPEVIRIEEVPEPELAEDAVLVRVKACSINKADWYALTGTPLVGRARMGIRKPKTSILGLDFAGIVEAVGDSVTGVAPGDDVFGGANGAMAELVTARTSYAPMPAGISFEEAAALPTAGLTALQALDDHGRAQPGDEVLVNGASGGVGIFAVQIAKAMGARVTAVCSTRNVDQAFALGADEVIDYTIEDLVRRGGRYDLVIDVAGSRSWSELREVLAPTARVVIVGAPTGGRLLGPLVHIVRTRLASMRDSQEAKFFIAGFDQDDLRRLGEMVEDGKVESIIDRSYQLDQAADALRYLGDGHARAKVVVTL